MMSPLTNASGWLLLQSDAGSLACSSVNAIVAVANARFDGTPAAAGWAWRQQMRAGGCLAPAMEDMVARVDGACANLRDNAFTRMMRSSTAHARVEDTRRGAELDDTNAKQRGRAADR